LDGGESLKQDWAIIIGASVGLVAYLGFQTFRRGEGIQEGDWTVGYHTVETLGQDPDGVSYVVQIRRLTRGSEVKDDNFYRPARSDGRGGFMLIGTHDLMQLDDARARAQEALDRASTPRADPEVIGPQEPSTPTEAGPSGPYSPGVGTFDNVVIIEQQTPYAAAGGTDLLANDGLLDGTLPI